MDVRSLIRTLLVALVSVGLVILVIVLLVKGLSGPGGAPTNHTNVGKYGDTNAVAGLLIDGYTNLDQNHRQVKITVSATQSEIDVIQGYQGNVIASQSYPSNSAAYTQFLQSLQLVGFSRGSKANIDPRGYCPAGDRYTYSFNDGRTDLFSYWSTSCGGQGTFQGSSLQVRQLFERQVPPADLSRLTGDTGVIL
ncbi:MAG TPA: hypothetical protein VLE99_05120 [Candidatus Saccharimonadales bacterium]|nr:hypothetical protein [Candidatus Saccharimonadales bacterium]